MKIVISGYVGKKITGIGRKLVSLLDVVHSDCEYVLYVNYDMVDDFIFANQNIIVKTYHVSKNDSIGNLIWNTFVFPFVVRKEKADRALIPNFTLLLIKFCPTIVMMHDLIEFNVPNKFSRKRMFYRTKIADPITAKRADKIITVSENSKKDIMKFLNVKEEKISVQYSGVDRTKFKKMEHEKAVTLLENRNWPEDYILYVGTIDHPGKNVMGVIRVFEKMKKENKYNGGLILAGMPGSNHEAIDQYVEGSEYKSDIFMTGFVTDEEVIALYSECRVFCFVSLYEGFGLPPLEALACGARVVVSNTSSLPEVVGDVGITVNPRDMGELQNAIENQMNAIQPKEEYERLVSEHLSRYDWENLSKEFENVLCQ